MCSLFWMIPEVFSSFDLQSKLRLLAGIRGPTLGFFHTERVWGRNVYHLFVDQTPGQSKEVLNPNTKLFSSDGSGSRGQHLGSPVSWHLAFTFRMWVLVSPASPTWPDLGWLVGPSTSLPLTTSEQDGTLDTWSLFTEETVDV